MIEKTLISTKQLPVVGEVLTLKINELRNLCNLSNLLCKNPNKEYPNLEDIIKNYDLLLKFGMEMESIVDFEIQSEFNDYIDSSFIIDMDSKDNTYKYLSDLVEYNEKVYNRKIETKKNITNLFMGYFFNWMNLGNIRVLNYELQKGKNKKQKAFNVQLLHLYYQYQESNSIGDFVKEELQKYYNGYVIGDDVLRNLILTRIRLFIYLKSVNLNKESNLSTIKIENIVNAIYDVELLHKTENQEYVKDTYRYIVQFCMKKFENCLLSSNETELFLSHARLSGVVKFIMYFFNDHSFLEKNHQFKYFKNFFEEIKCDCGTFRIDNYSDFVVPSYNHWLISVFAFNSRVDPLESVFNGAKQRIFLSSRVKDFLEKKIEQSIINPRMLIDEIKHKFGDIGYEIMKPISILCDIDLFTMRRNVFAEKEFHSICSKLKINHEGIYNDYLFIAKENRRKVEKKILKDKKEEITKIHNKLAYDECVRAAISDELSEREVLERKAVEILKLIYKYPYNDFLTYEYAIALDKLNHLKEALTAMGVSKIVAC